MAGGLRADLDRQQLYPGYPCRSGELSSPAKELVGVDVVPPRRDRHRRIRLERLRHQLTLQRFRPPPTLATRFLGVRFAASGHLSLTGHHAAQCPPLPRSARDSAHRKVTLVGAILLEQNDEWATTGLQAHVAADPKVQVVSRQPNPTQDPRDDRRLARLCQTRGGRSGG